MKKTMIIFLTGFLLFFAGCASENQSRQELVSRFQAAYPDNWQQKLLEYDIDQGNIYKERDFWERMQAVSDALRDAGKAETDLPDNYWQERQAQKEFSRQY